MMSLNKILMALFILGAFQSTLFAPSSRQAFEVSPKGAQYYTQKRTKAAALEEKKASDKQREIETRKQIISENAPKIAEFRAQERVEWANLDLEETSKKETRARETLEAKRRAKMAETKRRDKAKKEFERLQGSNNNSSQRASSSKPKKKIEAAQNFEKSREIAESQKKPEVEMTDDEFLRISRETLKNLKLKVVEEPKTWTEETISAEQPLSPSDVVPKEERKRRPKRIINSQPLLENQESMAQGFEGDISQLPKQRRKPRVGQNLGELSVLSPFSTESSY